MSMINLLILHVHDGKAKEPIAPMTTYRGHFNMSIGTAPVIGQRVFVSRTNGRTGRTGKITFVGEPELIPAMNGMEAFHSFDVTVLTSEGIPG